MNFFDYFQFIYILLIYFLMIGKTLYLHQRGIKAIVLGTGKKGIQSLIEMLFIIFFPLWSVEIVIHSIHMPLQFLPDLFIKPMFQLKALEITGVILEIVGLILLILALISFGSSWRVGIDKKSPGNLVTEGVFAVSRNPIFLFINLFFIGTFLIYSNMFFLVMFIAASIAIHYQITCEEQYLIKHYGEPYIRYMQKVRRYI